MVTCSTDVKYDVPYFSLLVGEKLSLQSLVCSFVKLVSLCRFQVHEDTDASFDDLSDCSSDSMEVCCDELGESPKITAC